MAKKKQTRKKSPPKNTFAKRLHRWLIPSRYNDYRPYLTRRWGLLAMLLVGVLLQLAYNTIVNGEFAVLGRSSNITVSELIEKTNQERQKAGLGELSLSQTLNDAAFSKAQDMFENNYWAHNSPSGVTPWKWLADVGYNYDVAGENLAKNFPDAGATVNAWMASPSHKANILDARYQDVGFAITDGVIDGKSTTIVVAYYGRPVSVAAASTTTPALNAAAVGVSLNPLTYFGSAIQSLSPATIGALALIGIASIIALLAHRYRRQLPKAWQKSWKIHHGLYKFGGLMFIAIVTVLAIGGGQI